MAVTINASTSSGLVQTADTSGTVEIQSNGSTKLTVASGGVTASNLSLNNTAVTSFAGGVVTSGTAVSASGTSVDFTGIPSWVKRITVMFSGVSVSGTSNLLIQLGDSGGIETTGYTSNAGGYGSAAVASSIGLLLNQQNTAAGAWNGMQVITLISSNTWSSVATLSNGGTGTTALQMSAGTKTLSDTLTQVRITTVNGTDTFDAGTINILYEG